LFAEKKGNGSNEIIPINMGISLEGKYSEKPPAKPLREESD
jgi:hypothetical protein